MSNHQHLIDSKQFYVAAWKTIEDFPNRSAPMVLLDLRTALGKVLKTAIDPKKGVWSEASKIVRNFERYLHKEDYDYARLVIDEITIPEQVEELDDLEALAL